MALAQNQNQQLEQRQEQVMTHQQIQSLELLAAPVPELRQIITTELHRNPVIEADGDGLEPLPSEEVSSSNSDDEERWIEQLVKAGDEGPSSEKGVGARSPEAEEKQEYYFHAITEKPSLHQQLEEQLRFLDLDKEMNDACQLVIDGLDDNGYLKTHAADLAMASGLSLDLVEKAVRLVQKLEPAGVAARNLQERFLIQLQRKGQDESLAYKAVAEYSDDLENNRLRELAKKLDIELPEVKDIFEELKSLNPHLAEAPQIDPVTYVNEEVTVENKQEGLHVKVNDDRLPTLNISSQYKNLLSDPNVGKETKQYIKEKIKAAASLIENLSQRQQTLERIANCIVAYQDEFFRHGPTYLKPLTMAQVAEQAGVHETTVSRSVAGKYLRCDYGLFALRDFFSAGYEGSDGNTVSNRVVSDKIRKLINDEDPRKPLSDTRIAKELKNEGLNVARRTVAKYREQMKILPSSRRRRYW